MVAGCRSKRFRARPRAGVIIARSPGRGKAEEKDRVVWTGSLKTLKECFKMDLQTFTGNVLAGSVSSLMTFVLIWLSRAYALHRRYSKLNGRYAS